MIKVEEGKYCLYSKDGSEKLGCYDIEAEAQEREKEILRAEYATEAYSLDSLDGRANRVRRAYEALAGDGYGMPAGAWVEEVFFDYAIVCKAGELLKVPYVIDESGIKFGEPVEVDIEYVSSMAEAVSAEKGRIWEVTVIRAGFSHNRENSLPRYYPREVVEAAAPLIEGLHVYAHSQSSTLMDEHEEPARASSRDIVGWLDNVRMIGETLRGRFHITATWLRESLIEAWEVGKRDLYGLSITGSGPVKPGNVDGRPAMLVEAIKKVFFVTLCARPAAGGGFVNLIEAKTNPKGKGVDMDIQKVLATVRAARPELLANLSGAELTEERVTSLLSEVLRAAPKKNGEDDATLTEAQKLLNEAKKERSMMLLESRLQGAKLPEPVAGKLRKRFSGQIFEAAELDGAIKEEKEVLDSLSTSGIPIGVGQAPVEVTKDQRDKWQESMDRMLSHKPEEHRKGFRSLRESWRVIAGPGREFIPERVMYEAVLFAPRISDKWQEMPRLVEALNLRESLKTSDWAEILHVSAYKALVKAYDIEDYQKWRKLVSTYSNLSNFQTVRRARFGGYGTLPSVPEQGTYQPLTSPTDEEVTYSAAKKGGTEDLTWEMILNDDLGAIRDIYKRLGLAAVITLYNVILDYLDTSPNVYDGFALFDATNHGSNTAAAAALAAGTLRTGIRAMRDQTAYGNTLQVLGSVNKPRYLWVPNELEDTGFRLTRSQVNVISGENATTPNELVERYNIELVVVDDFTDANDWFLTGDPEKMPVIEVGFLNGQEEPELFVQDDPRVGSVFSADKITYKIRHVHGSAVLDWRSFYRGQG